MILPETPDFFQIVCDTKFRIAELRWERYTNSASFRENYRHLVEFMKTQELNCALLDVRARGEVPYADQAWLCQEIFPAMITQLNKTIKLAYLIDARYFASLRSESPDGGMETYGDLLKMQFFLDESVVRQWLKAV